MLQYQVIGLGDVVAMVLGAFGIHPVGNCGCDKRRQFLNRVQVAILV